MSRSLHKGKKFSDRIADYLKLIIKRRMVVALSQARSSAYWTRRLKRLVWWAWPKPSKTSAGALLPLKIIRNVSPSAFAVSRKDVRTTWSLNSIVETRDF